MINRRNFLAVIPAALALSLPQMARATPAVIGKMERFCGYVEDMRVLLNDDSVSDLAMQALAETAFSDYLQISVTLLTLPSADLSSEDKAKIRAAIPRYIECLEEFEPIRRRYLRKLEDLLTRNGRVMSPALQRNIILMESTNNIRMLLGLLTMLRNTL